MGADRATFVACVAAYALFTRWVVVGAIEAAWARMKREALKLIVFYFSSR